MSSSQHKHTNNYQQDEEDFDRVLQVNVFMGKGDSAENSPCYKYTVNEKNFGQNVRSQGDLDEEILTKNEITQIKEFLKKVKGEEDDPSKHFLEDYVDFFVKC